MIGEEKVTLNITLKIEKSQVLNFEYWLKNKLELEVIKSQIVTDTSKMYKEDVYFKNIVKNIKKAKRIRDKYINENNCKYE